MSTMAGWANWACIYARSSGYGTAYEDWGFGLGESPTVCSWLQYSFTDGRGVSMSRAALIARVTLPVSDKLVLVFGQRETVKTKCGGCCRTRIIYGLPL